MSNLKSRVVDRDSKKTEFKNYGKRYDSSFEDYRSDIRRQLRIIENGDREEKNILSDFERRDRQKATKERQKRIEKRIEEYDYEIKSWDKNRPFLWQKSYIERDKTETRLLKEKINSEQENLVTLDKKWDRNEESREAKRKERKLQIERESREQAKQLEELKKWKEERQEKLNRMKLDISEKYQRKYQRFDTRVDQDLDEIKSTSAKQLETLLKGRQQEEDPEQTQSTDQVHSHRSTHRHKPHSKISLEPNKELEKRLENYVPDPEIITTRKKFVETTDSDEDSEVEEKARKFVLEEEREEPEISVGDDQKSQMNEIADQEQSPDHNIPTEIDNSQQVEDSAKNQSTEELEVSDNNIQTQTSENQPTPDQTVNDESAQNPISDNHDQPTEDSDEDQETKSTVVSISPEISSKPEEDHPSNVIHIDTQIIEDYSNIPKGDNVSIQTEDPTQEDSTIEISPNSIEKPQDLENDPLEN